MKIQHYLFSGYSHSSFSRVLCLLFITLAFNQCASELPAPKLTNITIHNTGTFPMHSPMACYYLSEDPKQCMVIDELTTSIAPGKSQNFAVKANQKVRLIFPFDFIHKGNGTVYRPNCHILADFFAYEEKHYIAEAQIIANLSKLENGFNCSLKMFEQSNNTSKTENNESRKKIAMEENATKHIRYRVPRRGEVKPGYVSNYDWQ